MNKLLLLAIVLSLPACTVAADQQGATGYDAGGSRAAGGSAGALVAPVAHAGAMAMAAAGGGSAGADPVSPAGAGGSSGEAAAAGQGGSRVIAEAGAPSGGAAAGASVGGASGGPSAGAGGAVSPGPLPGEFWGHCDSRPANDPGQGCNDPAATNCGGYARQAGKPREFICTFDCIDPDGKAHCAAIGGFCSNAASEVPMCVPALPLPV